MDYEEDELRGENHSIFNPEPVIGSEGEEFYETPPVPRLKSEYGLDASYWKPFEYGSMSPRMRRADAHEDELGAIVSAQQVPRELFMGTLRLLGDSIIACHGAKERFGPYPGILMSAWASFEAFVRIYSELLVKMVPTIPRVIEEALLEKVDVVDEQGRVRNRRNQQPLLSRYWWFLKFGFGCEYDRGSRIRQIGQASLDKRNELVHYKIADMPSLKATELWQQLEAILLLLIGPSAQIGKSVMPDEYELYGVLCELQPLIDEFEERPFFKGVPMDLRSVIFPCPFEGVDEAKFPTLGQKRPV